MFQIPNFYDMGNYDMGDLRIATLVVIVVSPFPISPAQSLPQRRGEGLRVRCTVPDLGQ
jgi:hypothetical protein